MVITPRRQGRDHGRLERLPRGGLERPAAQCDIYDPKHGRPDPDGRPVRWGATTTPRPCCCRTGAWSRWAATRSTRTRATPIREVREAHRDLLAPYLFQGERPRIAGGPERGRARQGRHLQDSRRRPHPVGAAGTAERVTHVTDVEQRSIKLDLERKTAPDRGDGPEERGLFQRGGTCCSCRRRGRALQGSLGAGPVKALALALVALAVTAARRGYTFFETPRTTSAA